MAIKWKEKTDSSNKWKSEEVAGVAAGTATVGAGFIDVRQKPNLKRAKNLGMTWKAVQKHIRPGDVLIGAKAYPWQIFREEAVDFAASARGTKGIKRLTNPLSNVAFGSILSKFSDPKWSHAAVFATPSKLAWGGGGKAYSASLYEIPRNVKYLNEWKKSGWTPHYTLLRPADESKNIVNQIYRKKGAKASTAYLSRKAGKESQYQAWMIIKGQFMDWITPKVKRGEKLKSKSELELERCMKGGVCSTLGAKVTKKTIGGKIGRKVLPIDYLKSPDYKVVGTIGKKYSRVQRAAQQLAWTPLSAPKLAIKGASGLAVGGAIYGGVKGIKHLLKKEDKGV